MTQLGYWRLPLAVAALGIPFLALRILGLPADAPTYATAAGLAVFSAATLLLGFTASVDIGARQPLLLLLALVAAVVPELALESALLRASSGDPSALESTSTILSASGRLSLGFGIGALLLIVSQRLGRRGVQIDPWHVVQLAFVGIAGLYVIFVALKRALEPIDAGLPLVIGVAFLIARSRRPPLGESNPESAESIPGELRWPLPPISGLLFAYALLLAIFAAEPFLASLREATRGRGSDLFVAVQTFGAVVTKLPTLLVAGLLASRGQPALGLATILTTAIAQLTFGLAAMPLMAVTGTGSAAIVLAPRQLDELLLLGGQTIFTVAIAFGLAVVFNEAMAIAALFLFQLLIPDPGIRRLFAIGYVMFAVLIAGAHPLRRRLLSQGPRLAWRAIRGSVQFPPFSPGAPVTASPPAGRPRRRRK